MEASKRAAWQRSATKHMTDTTMNYPKLSQLGQEKSNLNPFSYFLPFTLSLGVGHDPQEIDTEIGKEKG